MEKVNEYYNNENLKFEGEYRNGEKNGKCKEYYGDGELEFEGEYSNERRWNGIAKGYDFDGRIIHEIKYLNGKEKDIWY